jgi:hypothetical protein
MAKKKRRKMHGLADLVWDLADDVKDLVKDEIESAARDRDRDKGRGSGSSKNGEDEQARRTRERAEEMDDLRMAIQALTAKVDDLSREK